MFTVKVANATSTQRSSDQLSSLDKDIDCVGANQISYYFLDNVGNIRSICLSASFNPSKLLTQKGIDSWQISFSQFLSIISYHQRSASEFVVTMNVEENFPLFVLDDLCFRAVEYAVTSCTLKNSILTITFFLLKPLPASDHYRIDKDGGLEISAKSVYQNQEIIIFNFTLNAASWPSNVVNKTLVCTSLQIVCKVNDFEDEKTFQANCTARYPLDLNKEILIGQQDWFFAEEYLGKPVYILGTWVEASNDTLQIFNFLNSTHSMKVENVVKGNDIVGYVVEVLKDTSVKVNITKGFINQTTETLTFVESESLLETLYQKSDHCPFEFTVTGITNDLIELDAWEEFEFRIEVPLPRTSIFIEHDYLFPLKVTLNDLQSLVVSTKTIRTLNKVTKVLHLKQTLKVSQPGFIIISSKFESEHCRKLEKVIKITGGCRKGTNLTMEYPSWVGTKDLPTNYQPPSYKGKAIPVSRNVYHADPSKPLYHAEYAITRATYRFKQCRNKDNR